MTNDKQREAFEAHLKAMPEWAPEFGRHRAWVEQFAFWAWQAATAAERERCAKVCDSLVMALDNAGNAYRRPATADQCADAIRKG